MKRGLIILFLLLLVSTLVFAENTDSSPQNIDYDTDPAEPDPAEPDPEEPNPEDSPKFIEFDFNTEYEVKGKYNKGGASACYKESKSKTKIYYPGRTMKACDGFNSKAFINTKTYTCDELSTEEHNVTMGGRGYKFEKAHNCFVTKNKYKPCYYVIESMSKRGGQTQFVAFLGVTTKKHWSDDYYCAVDARSRLGALNHVKNHENPSTCVEGSCYTSSNLRKEMPMAFTSDTIQDTSYSLCLGYCDNSKNDIKPYKLEFEVALRIDPKDESHDDIYQTLQLNRQYSSTFSNKMEAGYKDAVDNCVIEGDYDLLSRVDYSWIWNKKTSNIERYSDDIPIYKIDWDTQEGSCENKACYINQSGREYYYDEKDEDGDGKRCCGDDIEDAGSFFKKGKILCGINNIAHDVDESLPFYTWGYAHLTNDEVPEESDDTDDETTTEVDAVKGDVLFINYPREYDVVSNGGKWVSCGYQKAGLPVTNLWSDLAIARGTNEYKYHYLCFEEGDTDDKYAFGECMGLEESTINFNSEIMGYPSKTGDSLPVAVEVEMSDVELLDSEPFENKALTFDQGYSSTSCSEDSVSGKCSLPFALTILDSKQTNEERLVMPVKNFSVNDWSVFKYVEMPLKFSVSAPIDLEVEYEDGVSRVNNILQYSTNGIDVNKWHLLRIPISKFTPAIGTHVYNFSLVFSPKYANYVSTTKEYGFMIDRVTLAKSDEQTNNNPFFCSEYLNSEEDNTTHYGWFSDLDTNTGSPKGNFTEGKAACDKIPYTNWTGTKCCGDDSNPDSIDYISRNEFYSDNAAGCWNGQILINNTPLEVYNIKINNAPYTFDCRLNNSCEVKMPPILNTAKAVLTGNVNISRYKSGKIVGQETDDFLDNIYMERTNPTIIFNNRSLWGCYSDYKSAKETNNQGTQSTKDLLVDTNYEADGKLIDGEQCTVQGTYLCDPHGFWSNDRSAEQLDSIETDPSGENITYHNEGPVPNSSQRVKLSKDYDSEDFSCCPTNYCWNGTYCIENQANKPWDPPETILGDDNGFRCIDGKWDMSYLKYDWDHKESGYCSLKSQCLVTSSKTAEFDSSTRPQCLDSGEYIGDFYCDDGNWSTRTKMVGAYLLDIAQASNSDDYSLYCNRFEDTLNYIGFKDHRYIGDIMKGFKVSEESEALNEWTCDVPDFGGKRKQECVNNFCVLNYNGKVLFGTSLNTEINATDSISSVFDITCDGEVADDGFISCSGDWKYNEKYELLLFDKEDTTLLDDIVGFIRGIFSGIGSIFSNNDSEIEVEFSSITDYIVDTTNFNQLYMAKAKSRTVLAAKETKYSHSEGRMMHFIGVTYNDFSDSSNVCSYVEEYDRLNGEDKDLSCDFDGSKYKVYSDIKIEDTKWNDLWKDLTAVLRLR